MKGFYEAVLLVLAGSAGGCSVLIAVKGLIPRLVEGQDDGWLPLYVFSSLFGFVIALVCMLLLRSSFRS